MWLLGRVEAPDEKKKNIEVYKYCEKQTEGNLRIFTQALEFINYHFDPPVIYA